MDNYKKARNCQIRKAYFDLIKEETELNPDRVKFIAKNYYVEQIAKRYSFGLTPRYIAKIINDEVRG